MSSLLLDTHTFLWWALQDQRLPSALRTRIAETEEPIYVSAASAWEIRTKHRIGKLPDVRADWVRNLDRVLVTEDFQPLPITFADGELAGALPAEHRDPFDRMLAAQALNHRLALVSNDAALDAFGIVRVW